ncbi:S-layer homology domain-containing protein [Thermohalobacter berrensis]|uniref:SLH domain-containing protein n=1 Tax=Thermohalobacter berrensis TaxID=99594 RepID=A0A419TB39_9FIRM|nr:S-layer homology domain-containing protein [Thermohalobacter berrensis]RKD34672.1 hypothetical protein BET03_02265 [Thermohalobacter berrensis]
MRRIIASVLVFTVLVSLSFSTAYADPEWKGWMPPGLAKKGGLPPGIAKKIFKDIEKYPWAVKDIIRMKLKGLIRGYGEGVFAPHKPVNKLETIIMALRVMGWEDESKRIDELPEKYKGDKIQDWAKGYITVAYEKGILDDVDLMYFNPYESAKRHEVAKYVIRALGYEEDAEDHMDEDLPFVDAALVPQGSVGYVYLVNELEIMEGDDKDRFNPMGTLTRAEMAVLFSRLDSKVDNEIDESTIIGTVYRVRDDEVILEIDDNLKKYEVDDDVIVYKDNREIDYDDIEKGSKVRIELENSEAIYIEIIDEDYDEDKIIREYTGKVIKLSDDDLDGIAIEIKEMVAVFKIIDDVEVEFENGEGRVHDIEAGDIVTITVDRDNRAREIFVHEELERNEIKEVEGIINDLDLRGVYHITIDEERYKLSKNADVEVEDRERDLEDLEKGMEVEAKLSDDIVETIYAENREFDVEGKIEDILETSDEVKLVIEVDDEEFTYYVDDNADIEVEDEEDAEIEDLETGQYGEFEIVNNTIVKIEIED